MKICDRDLWRTGGFTVGIKKDNYIVIQGFMITELGLKGNELLIYAIIYGFSQTDNQWFTGSRQYLADWTNSTKQGVQKCLNSLVNKGLLDKREKYVNNVKYCEYRITNLTDQQSLLGNKVDRGGKLCLPPQETKLTGCGKQSLPNNLNNITTDTIDDTHLCASENAQQKNNPSKNEINDLFERLWKLYPCKKGKGQISDAKKKRLYEIGYEEMKRAIQRYAAELEKDASWRKPQNGSTFFNSGYIDYLDCNYAQETEQRSDNNEQRHYARENNEREIEYARTIQEGIESGLVTEDGYFNWE